MEIDKKEFRRGFLEGLPFQAGALPFAMVLGVAAVDVGMEATLAIAQSGIVFAGTSQLAALQLVRVGTTSLVVILLTTLVVNLRMMMYSATLAPQFKHYSLGWRAFMSYFLIDQVFAFSVIRLQEEPDITPNQFKWYYLGIGMPMGVFWMIGTVVGVFIGAIIPPTWSLDFAIPLTLLAVAVPAMKTKPSLIAAVVGGGIAVLGFSLPFNLGLLIGAMVGMAVGLFVEMQLEKVV